MGRRNARAPCASGLVPLCSSRTEQTAGPVSKALAVSDAVVLQVAEKRGFGAGTRPFNVTTHLGTETLAVLFDARGASRYYRRATLGRPSRHRRCYAATR